MPGYASGAMIRKIFPGYVITYIISSLGSCISSIVDSLVVSNMMDGRALATMGIVTPYYTILSMSAAFFYVGTQIQCTRALGTGEKEKSDAWFSLTLETALLFSFALVILFLSFSRQISIGLGVPAEDRGLLESVMAFNRGFFLNIPLSLLNSILVMAAGVDGRKRLISLSVAVSVFVDTVGNLLAVTVFHMGIFGIALATSLSTFCADFVLALPVLRKKSVFHFRFTPLRLSAMPNVWKYGLPKVMTKLLVIIRTILLTHVLLRVGGTVAMGAMSVLGSLCHILLAPSEAICSTAFLMCSVFYGEEDCTSLRTVVRCILFYSLVAVGFFALLVFLSAFPVVRVFLPEAGALRDCTVRALRIYAFSLPVSALSNGMFGYIQGIGKTRFAQFFTASIQIALTVTMYTFTSFIGIDGVWWSFSLGAILGIIFCFSLILFAQRKENASISEKLMLIPASVLEAVKNSVEISVNSMADVSAASQEIHHFCSEKELDSKRAYYAALCAEEMAKNILQYGFRSEMKNFCSIRLVIRGDDVILRIRDNCESFNSKEYFLHHHKPEDEVSGIGIRLACSVVKDVQYVNLLKINTLTLII